MSHHQPPYASKRCCPHCGLTPPTTTTAPGDRQGRSGKIGDFRTTPWKITTRRSGIHGRLRFKRDFHSFSHKGKRLPQDPTRPPARARASRPPEPPTCHRYQFTSCWSPRSRGSGDLDETVWRSTPIVALTFHSLDARYCKSSSAERHKKSFFDSRQVGSRGRGLDSHHQS